MTRTDKINVTTLALSIVGALACFALGRADAGMLLLVFATGHALPSPLAKRDEHD